MNQDLIQGATADAVIPSGHPGTEAQVWAARISECWRSSVEAIIRTGHLLIEAKADIPHGSWGDVLAGLPFGERHAQMLMAIAADRRLSNPQCIAVLPSSWGTIYDLTRLNDDELERGFREQIIRPEMERDDIALLRPRSSDASGSPEVDNPQPHGESLQQGLDTSSIPGTADANLHGEGTGAASVANPEAASDPGLHAAPDASDPVPMPSGGLAIAHRRIEEADSLDFFPTPPWATRALIECVFAHLERHGHCKFQTVWEPACGEGHMAEVLKEYFRDVAASDVHDYGSGYPTTDFLVHRDFSADWIITNPPFNDSAEFVLKALKLAGTGVAMFVRLSWLESVGRYEKIFRDHPPTQVAIFSERVPLHKGRWEEDGTTMTAYIWLVWLKGAEPRAPFWIPPGCRVALSKPADVEKFGNAIVEGEAA